MKDKLSKLLEESISCFGISDEITVKISQKLDEEIVKEQKKKYEEWKGAAVAAS